MALQHEPQAVTGEPVATTPYRVSDSFTCAPCVIGAKKSPMVQNFEISAPLWRIRKTVFHVLSRES